MSFFIRIGGAIFAYLFIVEAGLPANFGDIWEVVACTAVGSIAVAFWQRTRTGWDPPLSWSEF